MASSENLSSLELWTIPSSFSGTWLSGAFTRDTDALTKALQMSISRQDQDSDPDPSSSTTSSSFPHVLKPESASTPTSGSDPKPAPNGLRTTVASGKIAKRKTRVSKRRPTTFITADPANFRQMVQQITGTRFGGQTAHVVKPEPQRPASWVQGGTALPTLDTSAFFLPPPSAAPFAPERSGFDFDSSLPIFPTLESWQSL